MNWDTSNDRDKVKSTRSRQGAVARSSRVPHAHAPLAAHGDSPILRRERLPTAVTRDKERVTVMAGEAALRRAVSHPVARASGPCERLRPAAPEGDA